MLVFACFSLLLKVFRYVSFLFLVLQLGAASRRFPLFLFLVFQSRTDTDSQLL